MGGYPPHLVLFIFVTKLTLTNYITRVSGKPVSNQLPLVVDDVSQANDRITITSETVTFNSAGAASSTGRNALDKAPIMNLVGDKVGSFWGQSQNKVMEFTNTSKFGTLTETATSASLVITDENNNLEILFEAASGNRRYILRAIDAQGDVLYGWIGNVTVSGDAYTIPVHNAVTSGAQSWIGTLASFETLNRVEIYAYESSFVWGTGTVLTEEVAFDEEAVLEDKGLKRYFDSLSAGQYGINYRTGAIYFKKATTGTSDTATYNSTASASVSVSSSGGSATLVDDAAFTVATSDVTPVGFFADETSPDSVTEGDIGAPRMTLDRRILTAGQTTDDAAPETGTRVNPIGALADETATDSVDEGDMGYLRMTLNRRLICSTHFLDDSAFGIATDYVSASGFLADDTGPDSVDEGDIGIARMSLDRRVLTDSNLQIANVDVGATNGVAVTAEDVSNGNTTAYAASLVIKASAGKCFEIRGYNSGAAQFIQVHDAASLPADTAIPEDLVYVGATQNFSIVYERGKSFATGIVVCNSSTGPTKTIGGADCWFSSEFE